MDLAIQTRDLATLGALAFDGVEPAVCRGEVQGFLGPNGAGESTPIRMLRRRLLLSRARRSGSVLAPPREPS
jgi:ABC-type multidrug transport system ATPase subunit